MGAKTLRLLVDLVPTTCWGYSLSNILPWTRWDKVRAPVVAEAAGKCQTCMASVARLTCHEVWDYDDESGVLRLSRSS